jgi:hypothetical protein
MQRRGQFVGLDRITLMRELGPLALQATGRLLFTAPSC